MVAHSQKNNRWWKSPPLYLLVAFSVLGVTLWKGGFKFLNPVEKASSTEGESGKMFICDPRKTNEEKTQEPKTDLELSPKGTNKATPKTTNKKVVLAKVEEKKYPEQYYILQNDRSGSKDEEEKSLSEKNCREVMITPEKIHQELKGEEKEHREEIQGEIKEDKKEKEHNEETEQEKLNYEETQVIIKVDIEEAIKKNKPDHELEIVR